MKKLPAFLVFSIILSFASCHQDPQTPGPSVDEAEMVRQLKEYTYFKEGSYWVYQDSVTGDLDSMYVYYADAGEYLGSDQTKYYWFESDIYSTRDSFNYKHRFHSSWTSHNPYRSKVFRSKTKPSDYIGETILFEYPIVIGNHLYWGNDDTITTRMHLNNYNVGALTFWDVVKVDQQSDVTTAVPGSYFICKNFGIVEQRVGSDHVWQLVRFHIVQ